MGYLYKHGNAWFVIATATVLVLVLCGVASAESVDPIKMQLQGGRYVLYKVPVPFFLVAGVKPGEASAVATLNKENSLSVLVDSETGSAWLLKGALGPGPAQFFFEPIVFTTLEKSQQLPGQPTPGR